MTNIFNKDIFYNHIISEDLSGAIDYLKSLDDLTIYSNYTDLFKHKKYKKVFDDKYLDELFQIYQLYYIECFYEKLDREAACNNMKNRFIKFFKIKEDIEEFYMIEENHIANAFKSKGYYFLGGCTSGYFGPYIWEKSELKEYDVELPEKKTRYKVRLNSKFKSNSWLSYISYDMFGVGGWADPDGTITCVAEKWEIDSDNFKISLLKHEAQHQEDYIRYKNLTSTELEYRAKLVELIYYSDLSKLKSIISEADGSNTLNGHAMAAYRIVKEMESEFGSLLNTEVNKINEYALILYNNSTIELDKRKP